MHDVDALFSDLGRDDLRFAVRGVSQVESPERLAESITTDGWLPADVKLQVSNVASLAQKLGGKQLYGEVGLVPLRELIQNAADAVRARRILENRQLDWGTILVRLGNDGEDDFLEVEDSGIGMSKEVLVGPMLDFGTSYWGSRLMRQEHPGLLSKRFTSTGRFGIGFFSAFMWGNRIRVTTRRCDAGMAETLVLEFGGGLSERPIISKATRDEALMEPGTRVRIWFDRGSDMRTVLESPPESSFAEQCALLCPTLDANLDVEVSGNQRQRMVSSSDWLNLPARRLIERLWAGKDMLAYLDDNDLRIIDQTLRLIKTADGEIVGRATLTSSLRLLSRRGAGVLSCGGFRVDQGVELLGILLGTPETAARNTAELMADKNTLSEWASEQARLLSGFFQGAELAEIGVFVRIFGGDASRLPLVKTCRGWMTEDDVKTWQDAPSTVLLTDLSHLPKKLELLPNVLAIPQSDEDGGPLETDIWGNSLTETWPDSYDEMDMLRFAAIEALVDAWSVSFDEVIENAKYATLKSKKVVIGKIGEKDFKAKADVIRRPKRR